MIISLCDSPVLIKSSFIVLSVKNNINYYKSINQLYCRRLLKKRCLILLKIELILSWFIVVLLKIWSVLDIFIILLLI